MYNLYFTSGDRAFIANLNNNSDLNSEAVELMCSTNTFMEFDNRLYLSTIQKKSEEKYVFLEDAKEEDGYVLLTFNERKTFKGNTIKIGNVNITRDTKIIRVNHNTLGNNIEDVKFIFAYREYRCIVICHYVPTELIYDVVLDFGSEASQMLIVRRSEQGAVNPHSLLTNVLKHFYDIPSLNELRMFDQQDEDDKLFRSVFFLNGNPENEEGFVYKIPSVDDESLCFTSRTTSHHGYRVRNIKISYLTGDFGVNGRNKSLLYQGIVVRFFHEAVRAIGDILPKENRNVGICFTILLPNVMPQTETAEFLRNISRVVNSIEFKEQNGYNNNISFVDVTHCSESDASFLEFVNESLDKNILEAGARYLIIDVGKGTTDFSVARLINTRNILCEYRAGFVGAGNALSYGIFRTYMKKCFGDDAQKCEDKLLSEAEPATLYELENCIEEYKKKWGQIEGTVHTHKYNVTELKPQKIKELIESYGSIGDVNNEIENVIDKIVSNVIKHVSKFEDIKYVVFSGRSFMFKDLYDRMIFALKDKINGLDESHIYYNPETAKVSCLFGPIRNIKRNLKSTMVGLPLMLNAVGTGKKVTEDNDALSKGISTALGKLYRTNIWQYLQYFRYDEEIAKDKYMTLIKEYMTNGKEVKFDNNSFFIISGNKYQPVGYEYTGRQWIYFDGNRFYLKGDTFCDELKMEIRRGDHTLMDESLFPYQRARQ